VFFGWLFGINLLAAFCKMGRRFKMVIPEEFNPVENPAPETVMRRFTSTVVADELHQGLISNRLGRKDKFF
jgi:hypothetical protein